MEKILLKPLQGQYLVAYRNLVHDKKVTRTTEPYLKEVKNFSDQELIKWLEKIQKEENRFDFAIIKKEEETFLGEVVLNEIDWGQKSANLRIALCSQYFDHGYGSEALQKVLKFAFKEKELEKISLEVYKINPRAVHVYKKLGFEIFGEGVRQDFEYYEMQLLKNHFLNRV